jgi:pimeloyl-ACP methyl ester carboxylesterase
VPLVLLHANTGNAAGWQYNIPGFVGAGYRAIAFDRRGWGRSRANPQTGPQPGTIAEDLHALVEHLKLDRFHLVGVAGGGFAAYDYVSGILSGCAV